MAKVHMMLQGKGGVGKSFISAALAQYKQAKGEAPLCIDADPVNATFHGYKALDVTKLDVMEGDEINSRSFDALIELIAGTENDVIVDNGAATFVPLSHYLIYNEVPGLLSDMGRELVIHTVVTGGQALEDTTNGFVQLARQFPEPALFTVWLNPYWGPIEFDKRHFEDFKAYKDNKDRVSAIVSIPQLKEETFGRDVSDMLRARLTFEEALQMDSLTIMARQRLKIFRSRLFEQMDAAVAL
jgi:hypothetical protein